MRREEPWKEYESVLASFRQLAEIRFKLLALLPTISGFAIGALSKDLQEFKDSPVPRLVVGVLGFFVTLGIVFYDQRNSQLYNALSRRARHLESKIGAAQFNDRPQRTLEFLGIFKIWHDRGLALIYGTVMGGWFFLVSCAMLWLLKVDQQKIDVPKTSALISIFAAVAVIYELHRLDRQASSKVDPKPK
jgi:hypothetical protein